MDSIFFDVDGYELVRADADDERYILSCMKETVLGSVSPDERGMSELWISDILMITADSLRKGNGEVFKLMNGKEYAGMLWMGESRDQFTCDGTGYIYGIQVREDLRGRGLGRELMRAAERWCSANGLLTLTLNVGTWNRRARELYEASGFSVRSTVMSKTLR